MVEALHLQERELADAMLEGIERRPDQSFGEYYRGRRSSCALGAAYEGIYRIPRDADGIRPKRLDLLFDCLDNEVRRCPACSQKRLPIGAIIIHLNDHHQWSRASRSRSGCATTPTRAPRRRLAEPLIEGRGLAQSAFSRSGVTSVGSCSSNSRPVCLA